MIIKTFSNIGQLNKKHNMNKYEKQMNMTSYLKLKLFILSILKKKVTWRIEKMNMLFERKFIGKKKKWHFIILIILMVYYGIACTDLILFYFIVYNAH